MKNKKKHFYILTLMLAVLLVCLLPSQVNAKAKLKKLKFNTTYKSYDVTRDGKKDTVKVKQIKKYATDQENVIKIYVNGSAAITVKEGIGANMYMFSNGKKGIILSSVYFGDGGTTCYAYNYKSKKFKKMTLSSGKEQTFNNTISRSGNKLKLVSSPKGGWWLESFSNFSEMPFEYVETFKLSKGLLVREQDYANVQGTVTLNAKSSFKTGQTIQSVSRSDGVSVSSRESVTFKRVKFVKSGSSHTVYFCIETANGSGWFQDSKSIQFY